MNATIRDAYLETRITTATPQRLRLMLIEDALRRIRAAQTSLEAEQFDDGIAAIRHSREIIAELIGGIHPDDTPLAKQVLGIYLFLFSALAEAQFSRDGQRLSEVIRVLEEEQLTWQAGQEKACGPPPDTPKTPKHSRSRASAITATSSAVAAFNRPSARVEQPYPGRS